MIKKSELILNPDGSVYHLHLLPEQVATTIITVGDPDRVGEVSAFFDKIEYKIQKREFVTHTGTYQGKRLTVISTGIGTDNIDIVLTELDALFNVDFSRLLPKKSFTTLDIVRIGTSGSLQESIGVDTFLGSSFGLGLDGLMHFYENKKSQHQAQMDLHRAFENYLTKKKKKLPVKPYLYAANRDLVEQLNKSIPQGITVTCPGFYAPQGRNIRLQSRVALPEIFADFSFNAQQITNFEMETAGIYGLAHLLGHRAISFNAILANRVTGEFSQQPKKIVKDLIALVLERIARI